MIINLKCKREITHDDFKEGNVYVAVLDTAKRIAVVNDSSKTRFMEEEVWTEHFEKTY